MTPIQQGILSSRCHTSKWSTFVREIRNPVGIKKINLPRDKSVKKDVKHAFGNAPNRFSIVWYPALSWSLDQVIMHNMTVGSEHDASMMFGQQFEYQIPLAEPHHDETPHYQLQYDLVEHL